MASAPEAVFKPVELRTQKGRTLQVREYRLEDLGALVEMYKGFEPKLVAQGLPPPDVPRIAHWLDKLQEKSRGLVALEDAKIVAHAVLCPIAADSVEFAVFVHQDRREEGLGTALSQLTFDWAEQMGFAEVVLTTELSNFRAFRLFRKLGFQITSRYGDECEMKLTLALGSSARPQAA